MNYHQIMQSISNLSNKFDNIVQSKLQTNSHKLYNENVLEKLIEDKVKEMTITIPKIIKDVMESCHSTTGITLEQSKSIDCFSESWSQKAKKFPKESTADELYRKRNILKNSFESIVRDSWKLAETIKLVGTDNQLQDERNENLVEDSRKFRIISNDISKILFNENYQINQKYLPTSDRKIKLIYFK